MRAKEDWWRLVGLWPYASMAAMKFTGKNVRGAGRGSLMGFPTINVEVPWLSQETLGYGVYAAWVTFGRGLAGRGGRTERVRSPAGQPGQRFAGAMHWGPRPTFKEATPQLEIFLLDFEGEVYGQELTVEVEKKIRDVRSFASQEELKSQIASDVLCVRSALFS